MVMSVPPVAVNDVGELIGLGRWQFQVFAFFCLAAFFSTWENVSLPLLAFETDFSCADPHSRPDDTCFVNGTSVACQSWEYDTSFYTSTIISEWDLVCSRSWLSSFSQTTYMMGMLTASLGAGYAADVIGRKPVIMMGFGMEILSGLYIAFSPNVYHFLVARFLNAFGQTARYITGLILVMEISAPKHRSGMFMCLSPTLLVYR